MQNVSDSPLSGCGRCGSGSGGFPFLRTHSTLICAPSINGTPFQRPYHTKFSNPTSVPGYRICTGLHHVKARLQSFGENVSAGSKSPQYAVRGINRNGTLARQERQIDRLRERPHFRIARESGGWMEMNIRPTTGASGLHAFSACPDRHA